MLSAKLIFEIEGFDNFIKDDEEQLPSESIVAMNSILISAMRGLLFATFKGTHLHNAFQPILDPKAFTSEN